MGNVMSLGDERQLRQRVGGALETITPPLAPVDAVIRKGKAIRLRRRIGAAAGLAAVAGIGIAVTALLPHRAQPPAAPGKPVVTVNPAGPHSPRGLISSGTVNGKSWRVIAQKPDQYHGQKEYCFGSSGAVSAFECHPPSTPDAADPVNFTILGGGRVQLLYGAVAPRVTRADVLLADGTLLRLHPVAWFGGRYVSFPLPADLPIARIVAYSGNAELRYAIPFHSAAGSTVANWLLPGQHGLPRRSYQIGSGSADGHPWSVTMHVGPWGYCTSGAVANCVDTQATSMGNQLVSEASAHGSTGWDTGSATASVDHVIVTFSDGSTVTVRPAGAGGARFYAFAVPSGISARRVIYYAASGRPITSQPVW
jgi:hypothetical protein